MSCNAPALPGHVRPLRHKPERVFYPHRLVRSLVVVEADPAADGTLLSYPSGLLDSPTYALAFSQFRPAPAIDPNALRSRDIADRFKLEGLP